MERRGDEVHRSETEASAGSKEGVVRWVLIIGLLLAVIALTVIWTTGALVQDDGADSETSVSTRTQVEQADMEARGEPIAPSFDEAAGAPTTAASTSTSTAATDASPPAAAATPGDAPAGDPRNDAM
ncbi:hypothetical protein GRI40_00005 [Altererythrobacter aerius]|uniref:Uncharacterized protein n=1 Tax=Tsuneonella aeria TaxID=1837929 RepID=A0A6I4TAL9_9SPHN|nr:hypothetical protein [Tsuneonella aeria]MXO73606.1 hypothetical protein [Tsuneonella aeria]